MKLHALRQAIVACGALLAVGGCQWVPQSQLSAVQMQNRSLTEQNHAQLAEIENLKAHNRTVENQLIEVEAELARVNDESGVERKRLANFERERRELRGKVRDEAQRVLSDKDIEPLDP